MPLYADNPSCLASGVCLDSLDNTVGTCCGDSYSRGRLSNGITVQADNFRQTPDAQGLCEVTVRDQVNRVACQNQVAVYDVLFFAKVSYRSTQGNVYYLAAAADTEHGEAALPGRANESDFEVVTQPMNQPGQVRVAAVKLRVHIASAGEEHAVDMSFFKQDFHRFRIYVRVTCCVGSHRYEPSTSCGHDALVGRVGYANST
jgi:hypothetical protein